MLELKLFGNLEENQRLEAAVIYAGRDPDMRALSPEQRPKDVINKELEQFKDNLGMMITGVDHAGKVVAVYDMPLFVKVENLLINLETGYLIAEPLGQHHGSHVIQSLRPIFERLAYTLDSAELIHNASSLPRNLLVRQGYSDQGKLIFDKEGHHRYTRHYMPQNHLLGANQERIVEAFSEKLDFYIRNL